MENMESSGLDAVTEARAALGARLATPWWYLPSFGAMLALPALALVLGMPWVALLAPLGLAGSLILALVVSRVSGVSYTGAVRGPHERRLGVLLASILVLYVVSLLMGSWSAPPVTLWMPAALVVVLTIVLGKSYEKALRASLLVVR